MVGYDVSNLTPGEDANIIITVPNMTAGTTAASATLIIREYEGATAALLTSTITTTPLGNGVITDPDAGGSAILKFTLTDAQTLALKAVSAPYLVYSVVVTNNAGDLNYTVPLGRIILNNVA